MKNRGWFSVALFAMVVVFIIVATKSCSADDGLPSVVIDVGVVSGTVGDTLGVPIYVVASEDDVWAVLVEVEYEEPMQYVGFRQTQGHHVTMNSEAPGRCTDQPSLRFIVLDWRGRMDMSKPMIELLFASDRSGAYAVHRTCWHRGEVHPVVGAYTFASDVTLGRGWDILDEFPETGQTGWVDGAAVFGDPGGVLPVASHTWSVVKELYR